MKGEEKRFLEEILAIWMIRIMMSRCNDDNRGTDSYIELIIPSVVLIVALSVLARVSPKQIGDISGPGANANEGA